MPTADHDGVSIEYETFGSPADPAVLLVNGFTSQLTNWEVGFCAQLVAGGRFVIRYDNRDVGRSTWFDGVTPPPMKDIMAARRGQAPMPVLPYTLLDMAGDGMAVLDALGIASAHIAGMSMGGMLVQVMALHFPEQRAQHDLDHEPHRRARRRPLDPRSGRCPPQRRTDGSRRIHRPQRHEPGALVEPTLLRRDT